MKPLSIKATEIRAQRRCVVVSYLPGCQFVRCKKSASCKKLLGDFPEISQRNHGKTDGAEKAKFRELFSLKSSREKRFDACQAKYAERVEVYPMRYVQLQI